MDANLNRLMTRDIPPVPQNILDSFEDHKTTLIPFEERSRALVEPAFRKENGVREFQDGSFMMSVSCPMHGVTKDMLAWWAWWFPQDVERYRAWMPGSNIDISYSEDDADYFNADRMPSFRPVTLYPLQTTGDLKLPFRIDLVMPSDFGFTDEDIKAAGDPLVICGRIKSVKGELLYSDFYYAAYQTDYGCLFNVRCWIGRTNGNLLLRLLLLNEKRMMGIARSCFEHYMDLDQILPGLYWKNHR